MMTRLLLLALLTIVVGCASSEGTPPPPGLSQDQLVEALDQIADTGEVNDDVLLNLTIGLENAGMMAEAASVQQIPTLDDERKVKLFAKKLSASVKKQLGSETK